MLTGVLGFLFERDFDFADTVIRDLVLFMALSNDEIRLKSSF